MKKPNTPIPHRKAKQSAEQRQPEEQPTPSKKLIYSIKSICEATDLGRTTVYELINSGELQAVKIRACVRITADSFERYLRKLSSPG